MSNALHRPATVEEFLAWERRQDLRYEFDGFRPVAMNGGSIEHSVIATNLVEALRQQLRGTPWRAFRGDLKILVAGRVRYPDAVVTCTPAPRGTDIIPEPVVVFEVLSSSTASTDRIAKNEECRATPSIQRYVMLEQTRQAAAAIAAWRGPGVLALVTHQVNITALTRAFPDEGEILVLQPDGSGFTLLGKITAIVP